MRCHFTILFLFCCLSLRLFAQHEEHAVKPNNHISHADTVAILQLFDRGANYQNGKVDSALYLAEQVFEQSKKIGYSRGELLALNLQGVIWVKLGNYSKGLKCFLEARQLGDHIDYPKGLCMVLTNLGDLYFRQGEVASALDYTYQAKALAETISDTLTCANLINLGYYYEASDKLDSALINTQLANTLATKMRYDNYVGISLNNLGNISSKSKQYPLALEYYRLSAKYYTKTEDYFGLCEVYLGAAKVFGHTGNSDSALWYSKQTFSIASANGYTQFLLDASAFLVNFYDSAKITDSAYAYQKIMMAAKDSLFSQEKVKQIQSMTISEQARQHELEQERLKAQEERLHNLQYIFIGVFIVFFSLAIILFRRRQIKASTINFMVTVALLLLFEFISLLIHPTIAEWTHHSPVYMLLILVSIAAILVPMHHKLEHLIKDKLSHKIIHPKVRKLNMKHNTD